MQWNVLGYDQCSSKGYYPSFSHGVINCCLPIGVHQLECVDKRGKDFFPYIRQKFYLLSYIFFGKYIYERYVHVLEQTKAVF